MNRNLHKHCHSVGYSLLYQIHFFSETEQICRQTYLAIVLTLMRDEVYFSLVFSSF